MKEVLIKQMSKNIKGSNKKLNNFIMVKFDTSARYTISNYSEGQLKEQDSFFLSLDIIFLLPPNHVDKGLRFLDLKVSTIILLC